MISGLKVLGYRDARGLAGFWAEEPGAEFEALVRGRALSALLSAALVDVGVELPPASASQLLREYGELEAIYHGLSRYADRMAAGLAYLSDWACWKGVEHVWLGGGALEPPVGESLLPLLATSLERWGCPLSVALLPAHPEESALLGAPLFGDWEAAPIGAAFPVVDLGGTNLRWGLHLKTAPICEDKPFASIEASGKQPHHAEEDGNRDRLISLIARRMAELVDEATLREAPLAGFCLTTPGTLDASGAVIDGARALPEWRYPPFHLKEALEWELGEVLREEPLPPITIVPDSVAHALSAVPFSGAYEKWGALLIGSGLGNCVLART